MTKSASTAPSTNTESFPGDENAKNVEAVVALHGDNGNKEQDIEEPSLIPAATSKVRMEEETAPEKSNLPSSSIRNIRRFNSNASEHSHAESQGTALIHNRLKKFVLPLNRPGTKAPKETLQAVYAAGRYKAGLSVDTLMLQSFMAGIYIAMAGQLLISAHGGIMGAALFPVGLIAVVLTSAELFTGDALVFIAAFLGGQIQFSSLLRNWCVSWCCNFAGCIFWAVVMGYASDALEEIDGAAELAVKIATKKALQPLLSTFLKAIGANFLVCVGIWQATCAEEVAGKVLALWFPIMGFVVMGFDHVVANQFYLVMGLLLGADFSIGRMFAALGMATAGNVVGGGILVGAVYWYVFDSLSSDIGGKIRQAFKSAGKLFAWEGDNHHAAQSSRNVTPNPSSHNNPKGNTTGKTIPPPPTAVPEGPATKAE